ncbi:MAG: NHLP bacteriocin export ABC transporter permease/ATPase subunit [Rhodospirillaceae bacterium]|jgi:ATP-binding cassette subfamily C protein|nr:NHLP bacteriocin export ABC transporter permease/ATPase subunit [Rhodospirillaceae bacterium]MBT4773375.1 NHLP bacteriocin export ABC transporter permease/ATPase subunit [Rhodospirillaceae bacterium]MBT5768559.1 NHLP bacteriocin export ABC transporter permease/ATPase subunit [Rhodospirillaceae bacterium]MBT7363859.1 NHLP bacteriocin export ABC transporter permease/ATPase subunit [Rhodospirillaceae bacterium]
MSSLDFLFGEGGIGAAAQAAWSEPARTLVVSLGLADEVTANGASDAAAGSPDPQVWLVLAGTIDLFFVDAMNGGRHHLFRVAAGGVAFDTALDHANGTLMLVPSNGARIVRVPMARLGEQETPSDEYADALALAFSRWVAGLGQIALRHDRPASLAYLDPDAPMLDAVASTKTTVAWFPADQVHHSMWADAVPQFEAGARQVPLLPHHWASPAGDAPVAGMTTRAWIETAEALDDLVAFHGRVIETLSDKLARAASAETERLGQVHNLHERTLGGALANLASVMFPAERDQVQDSGEPAIAAAVHVWRALGIQVELSDAAQTRVREAEQKIDVLTREAGLHSRKVDLSEPDWWRSDHGALYGFSGEERTPCALLPGKGGVYRVVDSSTGEERRLDAASAADIDAVAYVFSEPFPAGQIMPRTILGFALRGTRRTALMVMTMAILAGALSMVVPLATGWIMDPVIPDAELGQLWVLIGVLVVAGFAAISFGLVQGLSAIHMEGQMGNRVQTAVWDRLLRLPATFFRGYTVGDLANRAQGIDAMRAMLTGTTLTTLLHATSGIFSLALMVWLAWKLALVGIGAAIIYSVVVVTIGRTILKRNRETMEYTGRIQGVVLQLLGAVGKLRVAGAETGAYARWAAPYSHLMAVSYDQQRLNMLLVVFKGVFNFLSIAALIALIAWISGELFAVFETPKTWAQVDAVALHKALPTATFVSFHVAFGQFLGAVYGISQTLVKLTNLKPLYERIEPIFDEEVEDDAGFEDPGVLTGAIEIADVQFRYAEDAPLVLRGLTMQIEPGSFVAVVGTSGAGKSTLVRLLLGFDSSESGSVFYDGQDLAHLDKSLLRRQFGVVLQNGRALAGSLFDNISAGANVTRDDAMEAARLAGLEKDIEQLPMGLDTYLSEGASTLSGGQRQRMMIARAIVNRPKILIFDEATSALDNETQALVSKGLEEFDATRIVIAHRLSTIVHADKIFVLDQGKVAEQGSYNELMATDGLFAQLAKRQIA